MPGKALARVNARHVLWCTALLSLVAALAAASSVQSSSRQLSSHAMGPGRLNAIAAAERLPDVAAPIGLWRKELPEGQGTLDVAIEPGGTFTAAFAHRDDVGSDPAARTVAGRYEIKGHTIRFLPLHGPDGVLFGTSQLVHDGNGLTFLGARANVVMTRVAEPPAFIASLAKASR